MQLNKTKLKEKLKGHLNREPSEAELINAEKDINITMEVMFDELEVFKSRLLTLEKKRKK